MLNIEHQQREQRIRDDATVKAEREATEKANALAQQKIDEAEKRLEENVKFLDLQASGSAFTKEAYF